MLFGDIGFGEAYVDGDWDTDNVTNVIKWFLLNINNFFKIMIFVLVDGWSLIVGSMVKSFG